MKRISPIDLPSVDVFEHAPHGAKIAEVGVYDCRLSGGALRLFGDDWFAEWHWIDTWITRPEWTWESDANSFRHSVEQWDRLFEVAETNEENDPRFRVHDEHSTTAAELFPDGYFDLVYIDADHRYEAVKADLAAWHKKVKPGGWLGGSLLEPLIRNDKAVFSGVRRAVFEIAQQLDRDVKPGTGNTWWLQSDNS